MTQRIADDEIEAILIFLEAVGTRQLPETLGMYVAPQGRLIVPTQSQPGDFEAPTPGDLARIIRQQRAELEGLRTEIRAFKFDVSETTKPAETKQFYKEINAAHPSNTGRHDLYRQAMELVSERHAKFELVRLVNWLLTQIPTPQKDPAP